MANVTANVFPNVMPPAAIVPQFASWVRGPMSLQFMNAQVAILDQQIHALQSMRSSYLQLISFYSGQQGGEQDQDSVAILGPSSVAATDVAGPSNAGGLVLMLVEMKILMMRKKLGILMFKLLV